MTAAIPSSTLLGVDGHSVSVEVQVTFGLPCCTIVGLPDASCREARDRVRAAFQSSDKQWPMRRITINLAPSNLRKGGSSFDLAIAVGVLVADGVIKAEAVEGLGFVGELGLDGRVQQVDGIVPLVSAVDAPTVVVPTQCVDQASVCHGDVRGIDTLSDLIAVLQGEGDWRKPALLRSLKPPVHPDLSDVRGQPLARWAMEVAAAGGHNVMLVGPPGSGKTMLAKRLPGLLPDLDEETSSTATRVHSAAGLLTSSEPLVWRPPFRAPHHTSSKQAIVGGGSRVVRPGEASLAHGGVLFLDEMTEFPRSVLDTLRQPIEDGHLTISRVECTVRMPAEFLLIGAMNPCPCGEGITPGACRCPDTVRERYMARLSGPLLDRFDLRITVMRPKPESLFETSQGESSEDIAERVAIARKRALQRNVRCNAQLPAKSLDEWAPLSAEATSVLSRQLRFGRLTGRGLDRIRRVARTLADLENADAPLNSQLEAHHVCAALELRPEREMFAVAS